MSSVPNPDGTTRDSSQALDQTATFYVFPKVAPICNKLAIKSQGRALHLLEGAGHDFGRECFGDVVPFF